MMDSTEQERRGWLTWLALGVPAAGAGLMPAAGDSSAERLVAAGLLWLLAAPLVIGAVLARRAPAEPAVVTLRAARQVPPRRPRRGRSRRAVRPLAA